MVRSKASYAKKSKLSKKERAEKRKREADAARTPESDVPEETEMPNPNKSPIKTTKAKPRRGLTQANSDEPLVPDEYGALALAADLLLTLPRGIWWRLLEDPSIELGVSDGTNQEWAHISHARGSPICPTNFSFWTSVRKKRAVAKNDHKYRRCPISRQSSTTPQFPRCPTQ